MRTLMVVVVALWLGGCGGRGGQCGNLRCGVDQVCCNDSCGICVAPDESCIQLECGEGGQ